MRGEHSTHEVGKSLGRENRRDGEAEAAPAPSVPLPRHRPEKARYRRAGSNKNTQTTKLGVPAAPLQPRVRLRRAEVPAQDLRRERDARL